ncbi:MAG: hypothetical protein NZ898_10440 [Myxococcota bacterium]|nr:hypothetical protein [Myxococcota bacterium]
MHIASYGRWTLALGLLAACGGSSTPPAEYPPIDEPEPETRPEPEQEPLAQPEPPPPPPPVQVVAAEHTPIEGPAPAVRILSPRANQRFARAPVSLRVALTNWTLGPDPGNHIHVIVDDLPYIAVRDVRRPIDLVALLREHLDHELAPGSHVVRVFASRPHHESVKSPGAFAAVAFVYQRPTEGFSFDPRAPLLTYSRPKGCVPAGERVLLDFFVTGTTLAADGARVRYTIGSLASGELTSWQPHYIENLPVGEHTIRLTLVGADGQPIAGPFNDTTRTITVAERCPEATPAHAQGAHGTATSPATSTTPSP